MAILHRFGEVRALTAAAASFREGFQDLDRRLDRASESFQRMERGLAEGFARLDPPEVAAEKVEVFDEGLARLEAIAQHLGELAHESTRDGRGKELGAALASLQEIVASFEGVAGRLEDAAAPQVQSSSVQAPCAVPVQPAPIDESEAGRLREALRASELARHELEAHHAQQLTEMADHARRSAQRLEDDLKQRKRGLAELTQQNIALQSEVARLGQELEAARRSPERLYPALPAETGKRPSLTRLLAPGEEARAYRKKHGYDEAEEPAPPVEPDEQIAGSSPRPTPRARPARKPHADGEQA